MIRVREAAPPDSNGVAFPTCLGRRHGCRVAVCRQQQQHRPRSHADIPARTHMAVRIRTSGELMCAGRRRQRREKEAMESTRPTHPACLCPTRQNAGGGQLHVELSDEPLLHPPLVPWTQHQVCEVSELP
ncbi:hypothetical protein BHE74_00045482 [Ensete ventricosum]|nr:hypothetical protein GW17_00003710 [Ensete ventricosum]RWW48442.1 hypothetical protein BHE74_00045482 [Ensete ventricosum]